MSSDGTNDSNINARKFRGITIVNQICSLLHSIYFGSYVFEVAMTMRNSFLISSMLTNSSVWYNVTMKQIVTLEQVDEQLLRCILSAPKCTPVPMFYLETGSVPLRFILVSRRVLFLHYILTQDRSSMIFNVFMEQFSCQKRGGTGSLLYLKI